MARVPTSCPPGFGERYTAKAGDSMYSIAKKFGIKSEVLIAANPHIADPTKVFPKDVLGVP